MKQMQTGWFSGPGNRIERVMEQILKHPKSIRKVSEERGAGGFGEVGMRVCAGNLLAPGWVKHAHRR